MLALFAAALAASAPSPILESSVPWWERVTVTVDDKGKQQSCQYQISLSPAGAEVCDEEMAASVGAGAPGLSGPISKVTYRAPVQPRPPARIPAGCNPATSCSPGR